MNLTISFITSKRNDCDPRITPKAGHLSEKEHNQHQERKKETREVKTKHKEANNNVLCMDLQLALLRPKSNVWSLYF